MNFSLDTLMHLSDDNVYPTIVLQTGEKVVQQPEQTTDSNNWVTRTLKRTHEEKGFSILDKNNSACFSLVSHMLKYLGRRY